MLRPPAPGRALMARLLVASALLAVRPPAVAAVVGEWSTFIDGSQAQALAVEPGRLWVATSGGAMAFVPGDSTYGRLFRNDGLSAQDLTAVAVDRGGRRWFGARGEGLQVRAPDGRFLSRALDRFDLGADSVRVLTAVGDSVWVGTTSGAALVRYPPDPSEPGAAVVATINLEAILGRSPLVSGIAVRGDTTWFGTKRGVVRRDPDGARAIVNDGLADLDVRTLAVAAGRLWAGTATSVYRFEDGRWVEQAGGLALGRPYQSFATHEEALHVGAQVLGANPTVYRFDGAMWRERASGLGNRNVTALAVLDGELWAATNRGLYRLGSNDVWRRLPAPDPPGPGLFPFTNDYRDVAVIPGTGRARAITRSVLTELVAESAAGARFAAVARGTQGIEAQDLAALAVDRDGHTWLGHCCCGTLTSCRGERLHAFTDTAQAFATWDILDIVEAPDGRVWLASVRTDRTEGQGLYLVDPASGAVTRFTPADGLASLSVERLAFDAQGRLWIGYTDDGVDVWTNPGSRPASLVHLTISHGLPSNRVTALAASGSEVWVGTVSGIAVFAGPALLRSIPGSSLPNPQVTALAVDGCQRVWVGTPAGAAALDREGRTLATVSDVTRPGLAAARVNALAADHAAGAVWFATEGGLDRLRYDVSCSGGGGGGGTSAACKRLCPYPNPFRPGADAGISLADVGRTGEVEVTVLDAAGREIATRIAPATGMVWDGRDGAGAPVPSGVYLLRILPTDATCNCAPDFRRVAVQR